MTSLLIRYSIEILITKGWGNATSWCVYPVAYAFRRCLRKWNKGSWLQRLISFPLWMYLNDGVSADGFSKLQREDGSYNYGWFWKKIGRYPSWHPESVGGWWNDFVISYKWSGLRNIVWNLYIPLQLQHVAKTNIVVKKSVCFNEYFHPGVKPEDERHLKFKYEDDSYADNEGPYFNYERAVLGVLNVTYTQGNRRLFRWAKVDIVDKSEYFLAKETRFGYTDNHSDIFIKRKKLIKDEKSKKEYDNYLLNKNIS